MAKRTEGYRKIGEGALGGFMRQGLKELRAALPLADSPIAQPTDYGMWGVATPGEVAESRRGESPAIEQEHGSVLDERLKQAEAARDERPREDKGMDRE